MRGGRWEWRWERRGGGAGTRSGPLTVEIAASQAGSLVKLFECWRTQRLARKQTPFFCVRKSTRYNDIVQFKSRFFSLFKKLLTIFREIILSCAFQLTVCVFVEKVCLLWSLYLERCRKKCLQSNKFKAPFQIQTV